MTGWQAGGGFVQQVPGAFGKHSERFGSVLVSTGPVPVASWTRPKISAPRHASKNKIASARPNRSVMRPFYQPVSGPAQIARSVDPQAAV
jgi:hypothetical protein